MNLLLVEWIGKRESWAVRMIQAGDPVREHEHHGLGCRTLGLDQRTTRL